MAGYRLVVGAGATGQSIVRYLLAQGETAVVWVDSRAEPPLGAEGLALRAKCQASRFGDFVASDFTAAAQILLSPGVALDLEPIQQALVLGIEVIGDIELFARAVTAPVIAITGSNGKSTVTALVGEMAAAAGHRVAVGGNFGTPALDLLAQPETTLFVLELSSFQLEVTHSLQPVAAVVLNISADHLDRHPSMAAYAAIKGTIYHRAKTIIWPEEEPWVVELAAPYLTSRPHWSYRLHAEGSPQQIGLKHYQGELWLMAGEEPIIADRAIPLAGDHNRLNVMAAVGLGLAAGLEIAAMAQAITHFAGLPHRCQRVAEQNGVTWYNDSKGTNIGATAAALQGLREPQVVLIAGGMGKGADFNELRPAVAGKARAVVLMGVDREQIAAALTGVTPILYAESMVEAVAQAAAVAQAGDAVLLSPACASFDMFRHYADRGEQFVAAVRQRLAI